jgi:hypothetical protein
MILGYICFKLSCKIKLLRVFRYLCSKKFWYREGYLGTKVYSTFKEAIKNFTLVQRIAYSFILPTIFIIIFPIFVGYEGFLVSLILLTVFLLITFFVGLIEQIKYIKLHIQEELV